MTTSPNPNAVTPGDLRPGRVYASRMGVGGLVKIESVGPKWIRYREWHRPYGTGARRWGPVRRLLRAGWEGPYFVPAPDPSEPAS